MQGYLQAAESPKNAECCKKWPVWADWVVERSRESALSADLGLQAGHGASSGSGTSAESSDNPNFLTHNPPAFKNADYFTCQLGGGSPKHAGFVHPHATTLILG